MAHRRSPRPAWREVDGLLLLDKPAGISSNQALQRARHLFRAAKAGHTGSLDPLATGLLPVCFGETTKIAGQLLGSRKAYRVEARLGQTTDTEDADGQVLLERPVPLIDAGSLAPHLVRLTGTILQRPPAYSALKRDGVPSYRRARAGEAVELEARPVEVHAIRVLAVSGSRLELEVECGSGTYIRSLVRDLGEALGCGAHVAVLRRLWVEPFEAPTLYTLEALSELDEAARDAVLLPIEAGLRHLPALQVDADAEGRLRQGQRVPGYTAVPGAYVLWQGDVALGRGTVDAEGVLHPDRLFKPKGSP